MPERLALGIARLGAPLGQPASFGGAGSDYGWVRGSDAFYVRAGPLDAASGGRLFTGVSRQPEIPGLAELHTMVQHEPVETTGD